MRRVDNLSMDGEQLAPVVRLQPGAPAPIAVSPAVERRPWWQQELDGRVARVVFAAGVVLCVTGTLLEPRAKPDVEFAWYAQLLGMTFWLGALVAALGFVYRRRIGLLGALVAASSFAVAAAIVPAVTVDGVTTRWVVEMLCAAAFVGACAHAIAVTRPQ